MSLLRNLLSGTRTVRAGAGMLRAVMVRQLEKKALIPPHPLTNFEIEEYYKNESRYNGVYSRDNLSKTIKNGHVGTHWIALYIKNNEVIYFDSFGAEHVPKEIKRFIGHKNTKTNMFRCVDTFVLDS